MVRKNGGRSARVAHRTTSLHVDTPPVQGGFEGGQYKPLSDTQIKEVHETALEILESIGIANYVDSWRDLICANGGWINDQDRLCFPKNLVRGAIDVAARNFTLYGRDQRHDILLSDNKVYCTGSAATVQTIDINTGDYRLTCLQDIYDYARLEDAQDNIHFVIRMCIANELSDPRDLDINTAYALMAGTSKHFVTSFFHPDHLRDAIRMFDLSLDGRQRFRDRPFAHAIVVVAISPLSFSQEGCHVLTAAVEEGMPAILVTVPQAGATGPAALAGCLAQGHAEILAALTYVNLLKPGHQVIYGNWPFVTDLRTGAFVGGGGEFALLAAAASQLGRYLDLPTGIATGMSDAKIPDAQSGWEKGYLTVTGCLAGGNLVYHAAGGLASVIGSSYEAVVIDNDMIGNVLRIVRGMEVTPDTLSLETIRSVVTGPGHFLGERQTLDLMEKDYYYPKVANRQNIGGWRHAGAKDIRTRAVEIVRQTLSSHFPSHLQEDADSKIRSCLRIALDRELMKPGKNRWYDW